MHLEENNYEPLVDAIEDLRAQGYKEDFNLKPKCLECPSLKLELHPADFQIEGFYRFEGMSSSDDNSIIYAISGISGVKGILVDAYGSYSESLSEAMIAKLKTT
jgi:hypothetical protein